MYEFDYYVSFYEADETLQIHIFCEHDNFFTPVFVREYDKRILNDVDKFKGVFNYIEEYFDATNIKMTKSDLRLFYNTFVALNLSLPSLAKVVVLEDRKEDLREDLTPKEKLFLMYIHGKSDDSKIAQYWTKDYHLDIDYTIKHLEALDYITTDDVMFNIKKLTKSELAKVLIERDIDYKDTKKDIISTIKKEFDFETLKRLFSGRAYRLTEKGEKSNEIFSELMEFHKSYYRYVNQLSIDEYYLLHQKFKDLEAKEVCKIMIANKNKVEFSEVDWKMLFSDQIEETKEVFEDDFEEVTSKEDDFEQVISKYNEKQSLEIDDISDEEFLKLVYRKASKNVVDFDNEDFFDDDDDVQVKEPFFKIVFTRFFISSILSVVIIYTLYSYVFK